MGSPKALLDLAGETFLDRLIDGFSEFCTPVIVVLGAQAEQIRTGLRNAGRARIMVNPDYRRGQITSMQCGLAAIPAGARGVLFTLVDHPQVKRSTVARLLSNADAPLLIPRYQGRRGHPIYISSRLIPELLQLGPAETARNVIDRYTKPATGIPDAYIDTADAGILEDVDTPEAYRRLLRSYDAGG
jgi:molybdenum cofactor cytidylyltransferase